MPKPTKDQKILNKLIVLLLSAPVSMFELVHKLRVSERTVYRYLSHVNAQLLNGQKVARTGSRPVRYWIPN